jgi:very-short-patch-repair endonuclease
MKTHCVAQPHNPCASHPDFNRRSRNFAESTISGFSPLNGSWTITTGSDSHRPRSTLLLTSVSNATRPQIFPCNPPQPAHAASPVAFGPPTSITQATSTFQRRIPHCPAVRTAIRCSVPELCTRGSGEDFCTEGDESGCASERARDTHFVSWQSIFNDAAVRVASRDLLIASGATSRSLTSAVRTGALIRARRDHYALPGESRHVVEAVRIGGRLACVSALADAGLYAFDSRFTHVHLVHTMSRLRSPQRRFVAFSDQTRQGVELHWSPTQDDEPSSEYSVSIVDALAQVLWCQAPWHAVASIDSALFNSAVSTASLDRIFDGMPASIADLRRDLDGRAEAGQESILRLIVRSLGLSYELQVWVAGVGRVDMIVEGRLVLEADSRLAHDGWERHVEDRHRDLVLASQGYMSLRPAYQHTMYEQDLVRASILGLLGPSSL